MRLGLLGPAGGQPTALVRAARVLLEQERVDRAIYLGLDGTLDSVVSAWARELVGEDASEDALLARSTACLGAGPAEIDAFLAAERQRDRLKIFESVASADSRAVEILDGKVVVVIYDKANLDEEDILPATLLVFGKSRTPVVKPIGSRWFLSPGILEEAGIMVLEDGDEGISLRLLDPQGKELRSERLGVSRAAKMRVAGATGG